MGVTRQTVLKRLKALREEDLAEREGCSPRVPAPCVEIDIFV